MMTCFNFPFKSFALAIWAKLNNALNKSKLINILGILPIFTSPLLLLKYYEKLLFPKAPFNYKKSALLINLKYEIVIFHSLFSVYNFSCKKSLAYNASLYFTKNTTKKVCGVILVVFTVHYSKLQSSPLFSAKQRIQAPSLLATQKYDILRS